MGNNIGRPSKLNNSVVQKLTDNLKLGLTVQDSCIEAKISTSTFYTYKQDNPEFSDKIDSARNYIKRKAKAVVLKAIEAGDLATSRWYLQKYDNTEEEIIPEEPTISLNEDKLKILLGAVSDMHAGMKRAKENKKKADEYRSMGLIS